MRIHTCVAAYVLIFSRFFALSLERKAILLLTISAVISAEMVNTAAEELSDLSSADYNPMARIAKDVAAGAVLICAVFAVAIGLLLFSNITAYLDIFRYLAGNPIIFLLLILSLVLSGFYIFLGPKGIQNQVKFLLYAKKNKRKS